MEKFDLGLAYVWEYDRDFLRAAEAMLQSAGLTTYIISEHNIGEVTKAVSNRQLGFRFYLDRAWDVDDRFTELGNMLHRRKTRIFNPYKNVTHAIDKATMHLEFITSGIHVPYSIIIPPFKEKEELFISLKDLALLGRPFIIKPCNITGGGIGVVTGAETLSDILKERATLSEDKYILQEKINPLYLDGRRAWFRCFWAFSQPVITWWDDQTHLYEELFPYQFDLYKLRPLLTITKKIANLTGLDFFSTEIVLSDQNKFLAIDYINDQCDMRFRSGHYDGIPDSTAETIIRLMRDYIIKQKKLNRNQS
ncbi:MAG: hypothetical protein L6Q47_07290 [Ignavibacteriaceae bacterium]|nr:hypothetical protein [Ignavibacteriaceae bacterium]